ncbi:Fatty acid metabolism regulator protein [Sulfitobacter sp. THAF37]|uniref:TetR/AcrR family transcriptional regulator n=1 Tax=Sulfitobacter sp. THAF37 TaxID=2587855 RepID=UPI0012688CED|nr:TetR/AcrR family transcriptional regulator [Sulfitobacter sp. THAF37]QFT58670.1 Fatty acid metabolism regulator protein [Sulfitobacter sp. THAF37]
MRISPRKTPTQSRARVSYDAILEAAARILVAEGFDRLNTNRMAEVAGVSIGTLYQYFPSKEAILAEIIRRERGQLLEDIAAATRDMADEDVHITLDRLLRAAVGHQLRWPKLARMLEHADAFLPLEEETQAVNAAILQRVAAFLTQAGLQDADLLARDLVAALRGMIDAAGMAGETDQEALMLRTRRLARGYLGLGPSPDERA